MPIESSPSSSTRFGVLALVLDSVCLLRAVLALVLDSVCC